MEASAAPDANLDTTRPAMGRVFLPSSPSSVSAHIPTLPSNFPLLAWPPMVSRRHFCACVQQGGTDLKKQNLRKDHLQALRAVLLSWSVPIFQYHKTPYIGPQNAKQSTKQPRPTPSGESRGIVICYGPAIGRRSALCLRPTRRSGGRHTARRYTPRGAARHQCGTLSRQPSVLRPDRAAQEL